MAEVQRCWPSGQTDSGRHYREQGERRERKMKKTDNAHFKPTHKHGIKSTRCCGSTHNRTASAHTRASHVKRMKHTTKLARKYEQSPTCFSTLSHVLEEERSAGPFHRALFSLSPWWRVCDWGLSFAVFYREVTILLNPKHLKYLRPLSLFHIKGIARSSRPVAAHEGSWDHVCLNWVKLCSSVSLCNLLNCFPPCLLR